MANSMIREKNVAIWFLEKCYKKKVIRTEGFYSEGEVVVNL
jgi:hypothetical protein